jgi:hypothetical protein
MLIAKQDKVYTARSARANRGPRKQVFVCGVASAVGPSGRTPSSKPDSPPNPYSSSASEKQ